jgi:hypothetical protein
MEGSGEGRMEVDGDERVEEEGRRIRQVMNCGGFPLTENNGAPLDYRTVTPQRDTRKMMKRMVTARIGPIDLFYTIKEGKITCRACQSRIERGEKEKEVEKFNLLANWGELVMHYEKEHPGACDYFEGLTAGEMIELRQWLVSKVRSYCVT